MTTPDAAGIINTAMSGLGGELAAIGTSALVVGVLVFSIGFGFRWAKGLIS